MPAEPPPAVARQPDEVPPQHLGLSPNVSDAIAQARYRLEHGGALPPSVPEIRPPIPAQPAWQSVVLLTRAWVKRHRLQLAAGFFTFALLSAGLILVVASSKEPSRFVAVYMTDLPGGFEKLEVGVAGCTVGDGHPLRVEVMSVELSALHGPEEGLRVCSGEIRETRYGDGRMGLVFASARGMKDGTWLDVAIPNNRLTLAEACPDASFGSCASIFDFNLETSLVIENGSARFEPFVQNVYHYTENHNGLLDLSGLNVTQLVQIEVPLQVLDHLADEIVDRLCQRLPGCLPPPSDTDRFLPTGSYPPTLPSLTPPTLPTHSGSPTTSDENREPICQDSSGCGPQTWPPTSSSSPPKPQTPNPDPTDSMPTTSATTSTTSGAPTTENPPNCIGQICEPETTPNPNLGPGH